MKYVYPAVFKPEGDFYNISFPDLPGCNSFGEGLAQAIEMAGDALALMLCSLEMDGAQIPAPKDIRDIELGDGEIASYISCDTIEYRKRYDNKLVNKTVTIESWLNKMAEAAQINCSRVLRRALKEELNIK